MGQSRVQNSATYRRVVYDKVPHHVSAPFLEQNPSVGLRFSGEVKMTATTPVLGDCKSPRGSMELEHGLQLRARSDFHPGFQVSSYVTLALLLNFSEEIISEIWVIKPST